VTVPVEKAPVTTPAVPEQKETQPKANPAAKPVRLLGGIVANKLANFYFVVVVAVLGTAIIANSWASFVILDAQFPSLLQKEPEGLGKYLSYVCSGYVPIIAILFVLLLSAICTALVASSENILSDDSKAKPLIGTSTAVVCVIQILATVATTFVTMKINKLVKEDYIKIGMEVFSLIMLVTLSVRIFEEKMGNGDLVNLLLGFALFQYNISATYRASQEFIVEKVNVKKISRIATIACLFFELAVVVPVTLFVRCLNDLRVAAADYTVAYVRNITSFYAMGVATYILWNLLMRKSASGNLAAKLSTLRRVLALFYPKPSVLPEDYRLMAASSLDGVVWDEHDLLFFPHDSSDSDVVKEKLILLEKQLQTQFDRASKSDRALSTPEDALIMLVGLFYLGGLNSLMQNQVAIPSDSIGDMRSNAIGWTIGAGIASIVPGLVSIFMPGD